MKTICEIKEYKLTIKLMSNVEREDDRLESCKDLENKILISALGYEWQLRDEGLCTYTRVEDAMITLVGSAPVTVLIKRDSKCC